MSRLTHSLWLIAGTAVALTACDSFNHKDEPAPAASLTRTLTMMGADGKRYGTIELDPVTGGRMYDTEGRLIGTIITASPVTVSAPLAPMP